MKRAKSIFLWCGECQRAAAGRLHSSGVSRKCVRISFSVRSQIVCCEFVASALRASAGRLYSICQDFLGLIATFCACKRFALNPKSRGKFSPICPPRGEAPRRRTRIILFGSAGRIRTYNHLVTRNPILSYWRGLSHHPKGVRGV